MVHTKLRAFYTHTCQTFKAFACFTKPGKEGNGHLTGMKKSSGEVITPDIEAIMAINEFALMKTIATSS